MNKPPPSASAALPLSAYHILVTRPTAQAVPWAKQLAALGAQTTLMSMIDIVALTDSASERAIINCVLAFAEYQKAIFISQNAVAHGLDWLDRYWPQLPIGVRFFAIGRVTAEALQRGIGDGEISGRVNSSVNSSYMAHSATSTMDSEALLAHPDLANIDDGEKIIIFRGKGGRTLLGDELQARGAQVDYCELYERKQPDAPQAVDTDFRRTNRQPVISVHSGESLANLCNTVNENDFLWLQQQAILLPSQRVAEQAQALGFSKIIVADNACHDSMVNALCEWQKHDG